MYITAYTGLKHFFCYCYQHGSKLAETDPVHQGWWRVPTHRGDVSVPARLRPTRINGITAPVVLNPEFPTGT